MSLKSGKIMLTDFKYFSIYRSVLLMTIERDRQNWSSDMESLQLTVNGTLLELNRFNAKLVYNLTNALIDSLDLEPNLTGSRMIIVTNKEISIKINNIDVPTNEFVTNTYVDILDAYINDLSGYEKPLETILIEMD